MWKKFTRWMMAKPSDSFRTDIFKSLIIAIVVGIVSGGLFGLLLIGATCAGSRS